MLAAYALTALLIALAARDDDVRHCAIAIFIGLLITKVVALSAVGVGQHALWGVTWAVCAYVTSRQMLCSIFLFSSGLCYLITYLAEIPIGLGMIASVVIDMFGVLALLVLGGQVVGQRLGYDRITSLLRAGYPSFMGPH
jgi:hypothetical protein